MHYSLLLSTVLALVPLSSAARQTQNITQEKEPICNHCNVVTQDSVGRYGIMDDDWCTIDDEACGFVYWGDKLQIPQCKRCVAVYEDEHGLYGSENDNGILCGINKIVCSKVIKDKKI